MTIQNNLNAMSALNRLTVSNNQMRTSSASIASGSRINSAANDAAALAISSRMSSQIGGTNQAIRNSLDGISLIQTAESALNSTHAMLGRLQMLSVQSANGILNDTQRGFLQMEADHILSEINRVASATDFNGINLLDGSLSGSNAMRLQIGSNNAREQSFVINIGGMSSHAIGLSGFNISTAQNALNAINSTNSAIDMVSGQRAALGAVQNRLEHTVNSLTNTNENTIAANSRISDTDMASQMINYTTSNILRQVSIAMLAHSINQPQGMLGLVNNQPSANFRF
jgi:flagellin